ncbi:uncharacterized protein AB675_4395 [Cyphellophora attinorum]|uniref:BHLH domain-containing protein n=1 Tax=Cyphellophora attinorum TaxID=1664694 RepID=A0A0N0NJ39_9EURO|nr:uncharacterized protein AB675_4395 [Phialophora attinorum]KPI36541.1 hypothetical protein AB675_4395 [Phialophora attinorum]
MPRPKAPPTPAASTDLIAQDYTDVGQSFVLPPAAMDQRGAARMSPPVSPGHNPKMSSPPRKRTLSGSHKREDAMQFDLPPPPSRARKIIQMKPKTGSTSSSSSEPALSTVTPAKPAQAAGTKRKQPSATSAAGRKIARKTAHSIIERRRRSKMNEEFGVLKDMIPACEGVEMHKLAILQAGIEYLRYLEGCITQMKQEKEQDQPDDTSDASLDEEESPEPEPEPERPSVDWSTKSNSIDWQYRKPSIATTDSSSNPSPNLLPRLAQPTHRPILPSIPTFSASPRPGPQSSTPTPTLLSPAFGAIQFSPELSRVSTHTSLGVLAPSPNILPLPQAMMSLERQHKNGSPAVSEGGAEATATAALMMMSSNDRRLESAERNSRGKGMSVRDLLTS